MADHHEHNHSIMPYVMILGALMVLTGVTVGVAFIDFGHPWSDIVALAIAFTKASLVVTFFMHVKGSSPLIKLSALGGFFWLFIFFAIILTDYISRGFQYTS